MYSIEACYSKEKIEFNKPYSFIGIEHGRSTDVLSKIDLTIPTIIWLDYDGALSDTVFFDLRKCIYNLPHGSIYIISCNRELKNEENVHCSVEELRNRFGHLVPFDLKDNCCADCNVAHTIKKMLETECYSVIQERNRLNQEKVCFKLLFNLKEYQNKEDRTCKFVCVLTAILPDGEKIVARGECSGTIALKYEKLGEEGLIDKRGRRKEESQLTELEKANRKIMQLEKEKEEFRKKYELLKKAEMNERW